MARSMPKAAELTWQPGTGSRKGRWKKIYRGKTYTFPGGRGKSDRDAYDAAMAAWQLKKIEVDAQGPKPHQADYERVIREWEAVRNWCREYGDPKMEQVADEKLRDLRKRLAMPRPSKITLADTLDGQFDMEVLHPGWKQAAAEIAKIVEDGARENPIPLSPQWQEWQAAGDRLVEDLFAGADTSKLQTFDPAGVPQLDADPLSLDRTVWHDRLDVMDRKADPESESVGAYVERFLSQKRADVTAGEISAQHVYSLTNSLTHFQNWLGASVSVHKITSAKLVEYRAELLQSLSKGEWSTTTVSQRISTVKSFVRWLWLTEVIESFPRVLEGASLHISRNAPQVVTYTIDEIYTLLREASQRTRLYIILMLNCGMTQKDIADLAHAEVDWDAGRITRKRSKTKKHRNVPVVSYLLWQETVDLLKQERSGNGNERVLLNAYGRPLLVDGMDEKGKAIKCDNVRNAFRRLCVKTQIHKPLKSFKKTSATLLRGSRHYASLERVFLGHAPSTMSDKFYTRVPQDLLDEAITWLRDELRISEALASS